MSSRAPADYTVEQIVKNGVKTEVLWLEDTPPGDGSSANDRKGAPDDAKSDQIHEPAAKKRRGANGTIAQSTQRPVNTKSQTAIKGKRKLDVMQNSEPKEQTHDKDGHFIVREQGKVGDYTIVKSLGQGTFGRVVEAVSDSTSSRVAVKIIRAIPKYRDASKVEIRVLQLLQREDHEDQQRCIRFHEHFDFQDHVCIVTDLLSSSVFDFLKENHYAPFPFEHIQSFARQLLKSVAFLHKHGLIHTDLKPENILLESDEYEIVTIPNGKKTKTRRRLKRTDIRLIDFGSATFDNEYHASVVSTRHYRSPEIILGTGWTYPCDVWSIGCILVEFYTGEALFQTHENMEHLAMMEQVFGPIPEKMIKLVQKKGLTQKDWFFQEHRGGKYLLDFPTESTSKQSIKYVKAMRTLDHMIKPDSITCQRFLDLLKRLLRWDPDERITVDEALQHAFITTTIPSAQQTCS